MIIQEKTKDLIVVGEHNSKKAKISQDKLSKLQYLLTKGLYKDPISATIVEWCNNGVDSVIQAGKNPVENPVIVSISEDENGIYKFRVEDKGIGLDNRDFEDICMSYLVSTKETSNDLIGSWGIGMKSFLSLERSAVFICRKNGVERKYLVYEGDEFVNFDLIYENKTTEDNGVIAELVINNWGERNLFVEKAKNKLCYYDSAILIVDNNVVENKIYRNNIFQWSPLVQIRELHISLKDVLYRIDWEALGINPIMFPVAIRLNLGEGLTPTPSRESYITNEKAKKLLLNKIKEIADWSINKYNDNIKKFKTFLESYKHLGASSYYINLGDKEFYINPLLQHSKYKINNIEVEGIKLQDPNYYKLQRDYLFEEYDLVAYIDDRGRSYSKLRRIGISKEYCTLNRTKTVVVINDIFTGNVREYLKHKYVKDTIFLRRNQFIRSLGKSKEYDTKGQLTNKYNTYRSILNLSKQPKSKWRDFINEWKYVVSTIEDSFMDETNIKADKNFIDWIEHRKKEKRKLGKNRNSKGGLNKKKGDITLAYSYSLYNKIRFKKDIYPIKNLEKNKFLTILITDDDNIDLAKYIVSIINNKNIKFAHVGKREIKNVPDHFQFIKFKDFMTRDCKPFTRLASSIKFEELIGRYDEISNYKNLKFEEIFRDMYNKIKILRDYISENMKVSAYRLDNNIKSMIIDVADENDLYDKQLWDVYMSIKKEIVKYDFIELLNPPAYYNHESNLRYKKLVNQMLLFRKKYYNDLPENFDIVINETANNKTNN